MRIRDIARPYPVHGLCESGCISGDLALADVHLTLSGQEAEKTYLNVEDAEHRAIGWIRCTKLQYLSERSRSIDFLPILEAIEEGIVFVDVNGIILYANNAYAALLGIPLWRVIGKDIDKVEPDSILKQVLQNGMPLRLRKHRVKSLDRCADIHVLPLVQAGILQGAYSVFHDVTELNHLQDEVIRTEEMAEVYRRALTAQDAYRDSKILGSSPAFLRVIHQAETAAKTDAPVLVRGENGTGKELIAKFVQMCSGRRNKPFLTVNCAAIPESLLESELFGYEEGTFTGAKRGGRPGKFQIADGGTLFLDEIGDMPLSMQAKLLRVLQEGEVERLGSSRTIKVDVRIIAATNQPLEQMIAENKFRRDLFYRINVVPLLVPPLRDRPEDIILLAQNFLDRENQKLEKHLHLTQEVAARLSQYTWPGNVRELQNTIAYAAILCAGPGIELRDLPESFWDCPIQTSHMENRSMSTETRPFKVRMEEYERELIQEALQKATTKSEAIKLLGISRKSFYEKLNRYGLYK